MEQRSTDAAQIGADRKLIDALQQAVSPDDEQLATCARLRMRYPAGVLRRNLDQLLLRWDLSEDELHRRTRLYWQQRQAAAAEELTYGSGADS